MNKKLFAELKESLQQAVDHAAGKRNDLRVTTLPRLKPIEKIGKKDIAKIRSNMQLSQTLFARLLNISPKTVQAWEQGLKVPSGPSLKLLNIAKNHPESLL